MSLFEMVEVLIRECEKHNQDPGHYTEPEWLQKVKDKLEQCKRLWTLAGGLKHER